MNTFTDWLVNTSIQGAILAALVGLACWALGERLSGRVRAALWLVVLVRLALPISIPAPWSVFNAVPSEAWTTNLLSPRIPESLIAHDPLTGLAAPSAATTPSAVTGGRPQPAPSTAAAVTASTSPAWPEPRVIALTVWLVGALALLVALAFNAGRILELMRGSTPLARPDLDALLLDAAQRLGLRTTPRLCENPRFDAPGVIGWFRPRLVLPEGLADRLPERDLISVFLHELAHVRRFDIPIAWLAAAVLVLHWFNPLAWLAVYALRRDRELACDELALAALRTHDRSAYGHTLITLVANVRPAGPLPGLAGIVEYRTATERRLAMIARFRPASRVAAVTSAFIVGGLALVTLTDARPPALAEPADNDTLGFYVRPYTAEGDVIRIPGARWHVQARYLGLNPDTGKTSVDDRLTVVVDDPANRFWPVIMKLDKAQAEDLTNQLKAAIDQRKQGRALPDRPPEGETLDITLGAKALRLGEQRVSALKRGRFTIKPTDLNEAQRAIEFTWFAALPEGGEANVGSARMSVAAAQDLLDKVTQTRQSREGRPPTPAAALPAAAGGSTIQIFTHKLALNEHRFIELTDAVLRAQAQYHGTNAAGQRVLDDRLTIVLDQPADRMWRMIARLSNTDAQAFRANLRAAIETRRQLDTAAGHRPVKPESADVTLAVRPYKATELGAIDLAPGVTLMALPAYQGVGERNEPIDDPRVTVVIQDEANQFWPMVAKLGLKSAERLLADIDAALPERKAGR